MEARRLLPLPFVIWTRTGGSGSSKLSPLYLDRRGTTKIDVNDCKGMIIVPYWPMQPWFPKFVNSYIAPPIVPSSTDHQRRDHRELPKTRILAGRLSSDFKTTHSPSSPSTSSWPPGDPVLKQYKNYRYLQQWDYFCIQGGINYLSPTVENVIES